MIKNSISIVALSLFCIASFAQRFQYSAALPDITSSGYYDIVLKSDVAASAQAQWQDLRLFDQKGKEIPYRLQKENPYAYSDYEQFFSILENTSNEKTQSIVIENTNAEKIDKLYLLMRNSATSRLVTISGSDDQAQWYVVRDSFHVVLTGFQDATTYTEVLQFPPTSYRYIRINIEKRGKEPLDVMQVAYTKQMKTPPRYLRIEGVTYSTKDSNKKTYIRVVLNPKNKMDKLLFNISEPEYFKRELTISYSIDRYQSGYAVSLSKRRQQVEDTHRFELSSDKPTELYVADFLGYTHHSILNIEIDNKDNPPLKIDSMQCLQLATILTAKLQAGNTYTLYMGDSTLYNPEYDIVYFNQKKTDSTFVIESGPVIPVNKEAIQKVAKKDSYMVWIGLALVLVLLVWMTLSMANKLPKNIS